MRLIAFILIISSIIGFTSCETDFEVNANWKEIGLAYMILDKDDSVQYLKLNRLYLNDDVDANEIAQIEDSLYFDDDDISARLIEGQEIIPLNRVRLSGKDEGVFAAPDQWVYRTPVGYKINESRPFKLEIENTRTGYFMSSSISIAKEGTIRSPISSLTKMSFATCDRERNLIAYIDRSMEIFSGRKVKFYDFDAIFHYAEIDTLNNDTTVKELNWIIGRSLRASNDNGGAKISQRIEGEEFYDYVALRLEPLSDEHTVRLPLTMEFVFHGGGQELYDYINVNEPSIGIVQKRPEYTNIENGLGLFSSRITQSVSFPFDVCTEVQLVKGEKTANLGFVR
ncbi:MAG: hypothetical protein JXQ87_02455 [Bacteroidia bacterium]